MKASCNACFGNSKMKAKLKAVRKASEGIERKSKQKKQLLDLVLAALSAQDTKPAFVPEQNHDAQREREHQE